MNVETKTDIKTNVKQAVPFFMVSDMQASLRFYVDGLGFEKTNQWIVDGKVRWCWLQRGGAALMLQEMEREGRHAWKTEGKRGLGVGVYFICEDAIALWREVTTRGIAAERPFVGNAMWVTSVSDPDDYRLHFESLTDAPEESVYTGD
ncbi:MAG: VOC family protein [Terriglobales bacterium]|jgi:lactoylglutathione lyase